jgi:hypothetical protein
MLNMILKMKFNFNMDIEYGLRRARSTFKVTFDCDNHHMVAQSLSQNIE